MSLESVFYGLGIIYFTLALSVMAVGASLMWYLYRKYVKTKKRAEGWLGRAVVLLIPTLVSGLMAWRKKKKSKWH